MLNRLTFYSQYSLWSRTISFFVFHFTASSNPCSINPKYYTCQRFMTLVNFVRMTAILQSLNWSSSWNPPWSIVLDQLQLLIQQERRRNYVLHMAALYGRSPEFCKLIVVLDPSCESSRPQWISTVHCACCCGEGNVNTAKCLFEIYPESINIATADGRYPLILHVNSG